MFSLCWYLLEFVSIKQEFFTPYFMQWIYAISTVGPSARTISINTKYEIGVGSAYS